MNSKKMSAVVSTVRTDGTSERLSAREFARRAHCDERQIRRALARGVLVRGEDGLLDARQLASAWRKPSARESSTRGRTNDRHVAQANALAAALLRRELAAAGLRELELAQKAGKLIELEVVERLFFDAARGWRNAWLNWPARIAPLLAAELGLDPTPVLHLLTEHVHAHCESLGEPHAEQLRED
ncbi:hypothetical protein [Cupriavidus metallidurans]|uniref:hypothetical protein n=1 Tax=Cupriavidus metallidurans TaxID=119219 RepID=UPI001BFC56F2|nr:hypothetical protein [Cupriavidus metallidurans]QWC87784.1 hypothetical protein KB891_12105 [Cupriavidus metallidurans]